jgi:hypothetical protein
MSSNDPAPPLSLPGHKDVTEEAVATALGYVGQVVQLLAAYLGKSLVYPVTCVGSRSLIRDGISAMVGPRMCESPAYLVYSYTEHVVRFPLYSKGVDTYRFEYGVFLLNKDIELVCQSACRDSEAADHLFLHSSWPTATCELSTCDTLYPTSRTFFSHSPTVKAPA